MSRTQVEYCEHGIITHDGSVKDYWVPADKYRVVANYDEKIPLTDGLHQVRNLVLTGTFDPTDTELPRISYNKLHEIMIGATSPLKRKKGMWMQGGSLWKIMWMQKEWSELPQWVQV
jgi:hypothetical protein